MDLSHVLIHVIVIPPSQMVYGNAFGLSIICNGAKGDSKRMTYVSPHKHLSCCTKDSFRSFKIIHSSPGTNEVFI